MAALSDFYDGMHGVVFPFAGSVAPSGFLLCDGSVYNTADYPVLFSVIASAFNIGGEAAGTFRVPDIRGRVIAGRDNMGGTAAGRITTAAAGFDGTTLGAAGGAPNVALSSAQIPPHNHPVFLNDPGHTHATSTAGLKLLGPGSSNGFTSGSLGEYTLALANAATDITVGDTAGGVGTANQTAQNVGGGNAHANMQPTLIMHYIIKT